MPTITLKINCAHERCDNLILIPDAAIVGLYSDPPLPEVQVDEVLANFGWVQDGSRAFCKKHQQKDAVE